MDSSSIKINNMAEELDTNLPIDENLNMSDSMNVGQDIVTPDVTDVENFYRRLDATTTNPDDFIPSKKNYLPSNKKWASQYLNQKITYRSSDKNQDAPITGREFLKKYKNIDFNKIENDPDNVSKEMANDYLNLLAPYSADLQKGLSEFQKDGTSPTLDRLYSLNPILFKQLSTFQLTSESRPKPKKPEEQRWVGVTEGETNRTNYKEADSRDYIPKDGLWAYQSLIKDLKDKRGINVKTTDPVEILQIYQDLDKAFNWDPLNFETAKKLNIPLGNFDKYPTEKMMHDPRTGQQIPVSQMLGYTDPFQERNEELEKSYRNRKYVYNQGTNTWQKLVPATKPIDGTGEGEFIPRGWEPYTYVTETDAATVFLLNSRSNIAASTSEKSTVYPDQDGNQYILDTENNLWKKLNKNGKFEYVLNDKIIKGLNYTYKKEGTYINKIGQKNKQVLEQSNKVLNTYINDINRVINKDFNENNTDKSYLEKLNNFLKKYEISFGVGDKSLLGNVPVLGSISDVLGVTDQTLYVNIRRGDKIISQQQFQSEDPDLYKKVQAFLSSNDQHAVDLMMDNQFHMLDAKNKLSEKEKQQKKIDELSFQDERTRNIGETLVGQTTMLRQQQFVAEKKAAEEFAAQTPEAIEAREKYLKDVGIRAVEAEGNSYKIVALAGNTPKLTKDIARQLDNNAYDIKVFNEKQKAFSQEINEYNSYAGVLETAKKV